MDEAFEAIMSDYADDPMPVNPLKEKWDREYPKGNCKGWGYGCMFCDDCPKGEYWVVPTEDIDVYADYMEALNEWYKRHPEFHDRVMNIEIELGEPEGGAE